MEKKKNVFLYNILFVMVCAAIVIFLLNAPPETTAKVPYDENHKAFFSMPRKEAEKHCSKCHGKEGGIPFPKDHPPKYRCLFCHKKAEKSVSGE